jgi:membrane-associated phospholipid phosphatase
LIPDGPLAPDDPSLDPDGPPVQAGSSTPATAPGRTEAMAGAILMGLSIVAGAVVRVHPGPNALDRGGFALIAKSTDSTFLHWITDLGSPVALVVGTLLAAMVVVRIDRWRAAACVVGPVVTAVLVEYVFKPLVARRYLGVLSYPSGNVADIAAVMTAWALAVPGWIRPAVVALGAVVVSLMIVSVIGLRWHYPTDALAGAVLGVGTVLTVDGLVHLR